MSGKFPETCIVCGHKTKKDGFQWWCPNAKNHDYLSNIKTEVVEEMGIKTHLVVSIQTTRSTTRSFEKTSNLNERAKLNSERFFQIKGIPHLANRSYTLRTAFEDVFNYADKPEEDSGYRYYLEKMIKDTPDEYILIFSTERPR